jgi:hypothetical protein
MKNTRAAAVLAVMALLFLVGTPGLDHLGSRLSIKERARLNKRFGPAIGSAAASVMGLNKTIRAPVKKHLGGFQPLFRVRQSWNLYRDGPRKVYRLEIRVDGEPVYRSEDPVLTWLQPQLRNRRLRPVVESTTKKNKSGNWRGLSRYVVQQARAEWPEATKVELVALKRRRSATRLKSSHRITSTAPDWGLEKTP